MSVKYTAVNGGTEAEVAETTTSCVADDSGAIHTNKSEHRISRTEECKQHSETDTAQNMEEPSFGGKTDQEQTIFCKGELLKQRSSQAEVDTKEGELEVNSVFEDDLSRQHFSGLFHPKVKNPLDEKLRKQEILMPARKSCFCRQPSESQSEISCRQLGMSKCNSVADTVQLEALYEEPLRKRALRACFTFVYVILAAVAVLATYSMVNDLVVSVQNPVRSIHYKLTNEYRAPGIAVYPGGADFTACGHYFNNVVTSKVRLSQLDLVKRNCTHTRLLYTDPHYPDTARDVIVFRGPTSFSQREAFFMHFTLEDKSRDFFTVSYFVFDGYDNFANMSFEDQQSTILHFHTYVPTFALSAGLRMWIKLIMSETFLLDGTKHTNFDVEYSVVRFHDTRPLEERDKHLFFIFFEWKNNLVEQSTLIYSTTPWSVLAGLCGVFLMLHRFYLLAQTSYKRVQKDKRKRTLRRETLRRLRESTNSMGNGRREGVGSEGTF